MSVIVETHAAFTSLVFSALSVDRVCPTHGMHIFRSTLNPDRIVSGSCGSFKCRACGPNQVMKRALAINWAANQASHKRFITLTLAPDDLVQRANKVRELKRTLNRWGYPWDFAYCTERNPKNTGWHIHGLQYGSRFVPQRALSVAWGHRVDIRYSYEQAPKSILYATKGGKGGIFYSAKGGKDNYQEFMTINGPQPIKWSQNYFLGLPIKEAIKRAYEDLNGPAGDWEAVWCEEWAARHHGEYKGKRPPTPIALLRKD